VKETLQNSFDAIKGAQEKGKLQKGRITIQMDDANRTISTLDNGLGMEAQTLASTFLKAGGSKKETVRPSGGFGIAKLLYLLENKAIRVITMRNGVVSRLTSTGPEIEKAMKNIESGGKGANVTTSGPTAEDHAMFPEGHGTFIEVTVPQNFVNANSKKIEDIPFRTYAEAHPALLKSPLFADIEVTFNGRPQNIGARFASDSFTEYDNVDFPAWGEARVYVGKEEKKFDNYDDNVHILSNGIWQFSVPMPKDPAQPYKGLIAREFYIDVSTAPGVTPQSEGYPFDLNRQGFSENAQKEFETLFHYIIKTFELHDYNLDVENFGDLQFLMYNEKKNAVEVSATQSLKPPPSTRQASPVERISGSDKIVVQGGKLKAKGKVVKNLSLEDISKFVVDKTKLKLKPGTIPTNSLVLHENTIVNPPKVVGGASTPDTSLAPKGLIQMAHEKFGHRVYEYAFAMADAMQELRDIVARVMPNKEYEKLVEEVVGISVDKEYHGVSIRIPFHAALLNVFLTKGTGLPAAMNLIFTMLHEFAHHVHRSEEGLGPHIQNMASQLWTAANPAPGSNIRPFDFQAFAQKVANILGTYKDIVEYTNGVYNSGAIRSRGKRLSVSAESAGVGRSLGSLGDPDLTTRDGRRLSDWVEASQRDVGPDAGRGAGGATIASTGGDPTFGQAENQRAHDAESPGQSAVQQTDELRGARQAVAAVFGGQNQVPTPVKQLAAHADRMNWWYKWMMGLDQLVNQFPGFAPLLRYAERVRLMHNEEAQIQDAAVRIGKDWRRLGAQAENLSAYLDDLANMVYRTPKEVAQGISRNPTPQEVAALEQTHKLSPDAKKVRDKVLGMFSKFLDMTAQNATDTAVRLISDPVALTNRIVEIANQVKMYKSRPYFPFTRFGRYFVTVKDSAGKVVHFETFDRLGLKSGERRQQEFKAKMEATARANGQGWVVTDGILPENAEPFLGMSSFLLDAIGSDLTLTPQQKDALEQLQYQYSPAASFRHYFQHKNYTPGYSMQFQRSFARYFFHGAKYYARTKHAWALEDDITAARRIGGNNAGRIGDYMDDHMKNTVLDAKGDHGWAKGAIFLWAMGYVPAAAMQNMSQTPMITFPFLWAKFGSAKATGAIFKAMTDLTTYYKKGTYPGMTDFEMKALSYGITTGRVSETQAADLAGMAQGAGLLYGLGGTKIQRQAVWVQEKAAWMFEMAEQFNRRIAYRAGLRLALENPNARIVQEAINKSEAEYKFLMGAGYTAREAAAIVTAAHTVDQTQYVYARYARPRFMRGKLPGTILVFKKYMQSTLTMLGQNKSDVLPRFLLVAFFMGGLAAWPGWDDLREIVKGVGRWKFGKDWDLDKEVRNYVLQYTDGRVPPDMVLHGFARRGFGVPALLDLMGSFFTGRPGRGFDPAQQQAKNIPFPVLDRSKAIAMGNIGLAEIGKLIGPAKDVNATIGEQVEKASGAVFSVGFNMYKAIMDNHLAVDDPKRWERAVPRLLGSASKMFRAYAEGRERSGQRGPGAASTIVPYDRRDTEHLLEMIAIGMGYQTWRQQSRWDFIMAEQEVEKFHDMRRQGLMEQFFEAQRGKLPKEIETARQEIRDYNASIKDTPYRGKAITGDTLVRSVESRARELAMREIGVPSKISNVPINKEIRRLYPEGVIEQRPVR
jgi:hypothetical protein